MNRKSIWAVVAGVLFIIVVTTVVDIALHVLGVFPIESSSASAVPGSRLDSRPRSP
jgi:hypothetical protein